MAGDLEDFLKRAAARRQAKAGNDAAKKKATRPVSPPKPEYTDARRERQVQPPIDDEPLVAEVIETRDPLAEKRALLAKSKREAAEASARSAKKTQDIHKVRDTDSGAGSADSVRLRNDLLAALRTPQGIRQSILLREILERPDHSRWD